jgi:surfeit locus 1 family protein
MSADSLGARGRARFWWLTLATALAVAATGALGVWQLGRAAQKEALRTQREQRQSMPPIGWDELRDAQARQALPELFDRPVRLEGRWLHEATVFLDNRALEGRSGFIVVTPLQMEGRAVHLLIQRGWVPRRFDDRTAVPSLPQTAGRVSVEGRLSPPPSKLFEPGPASTGLIRQNIDLEALAVEWKLSPLPASLMQSGPGPDDDGLVRRWLLIGTDVHKHYGYALQWFGLSALLVILYVWFQFIAPRRRP